MSDQHLRFLESKVLGGDKSALESLKVALLRDRGHEVEPVVKGAEGIAAVASMVVRIFRQELSPEERLAALSLLEDSFCFGCGGPAYPTEGRGERCPCP